MLAVQTHCAHLYCMHSLESTTSLDANRAWIRRQIIICSLLRQLMGTLKKRLQASLGEEVLLVLHLYTRHGSLSCCNIACQYFSSTLPWQQDTY